MTVCVTAGVFDDLCGDTDRESGVAMRDDVTDGLAIRRRAAMWRWLLAVGIAAVLLVALVVVLLRLDDDRSPGSLALATVTALLAGAAVVVTWLESRRINRHLNRTIERLIDTESELRLLLDDLPEAVMSLDAVGIVRGANAKAAELTGEPRRARSTGRPFAALVEPARGSDLGAWLATGRTERPAEPITFRLPHADGWGVTLVEATADRPRQADTGLIVRLRDVTEREERVRALEQARRRFQQAFHSAPTGMALVRLDDSTILDANRSLAEMLDRPDRRARRAQHPRHHPPRRPARRGRLPRPPRARDRRHVPAWTSATCAATGEFVWARTRVAVTEDEGVPLAITHIEDVTEQRRTAERLQWAATHDDLTGLPNRTRADPPADAILDGAGDRCGRRAVHRPRQLQGRQRQPRSRHRRRAADACMSERLREVVGADADAGPLRRRRVHRHARRPATASRSTVAEDDPRHGPPGRSSVDGTELFVSTQHRHVGRTTASGVTAAELLRDADAAMYRAKARGRDCVEAFAPGTRETSVLALRTSSELRRGLERGEIVPYFQPIVDLDDRSRHGLRGAGPLAAPRARAAGPGPVPADGRGDRAASARSARRSCSDSLAQLARWRARELPFADVSISVNVGSPPARRPGLRRRSSPRRWRESGIPADSLWLEITETALMADVKAATVALRNLRSLGLHLAVDDFGTGYSSLTYLKRFPVEAIKVDRSSSPGSASTPRTRRSSRPSSTSATRSASWWSPRAWRRRCSCRGCGRWAATAARATSSGAPARPPSSRPSASPRARTPNRRDRLAVVVSRPHVASHATSHVDPPPLMSLPRPLHDRAR